jgi:hypothetical protein
MEHACGFDRSQLYSDEGPPIGEVAAEARAETAFDNNGLEMLRRTWHRHFGGSAYVMRSLSMREGLYVVRTLASMTLVGALLPIVSLAQNNSFDGTIVGYEHGFLTVIDSACHRHVLSGWAGGLPADTLRSWGWQHAGQHVRVALRMNEDEEVPLAISSHSGPNEITRCEKEQRSFETHIDGFITQWSEGVMVGEFKLRETSGATRVFGFHTGREPRVDGRFFYCESSDMGCAGFAKLAHTKVRVFYEIIDSPDGTTIKPLRIESL